jgi:hypothetical protein
VKEVFHGDGRKILRIPVSRQVPSLAAAMKSGMKCRARRMGAPSGTPGRMVMELSSMRVAEMKPETPEMVVFVFDG